MSATRDFRAEIVSQDNIAPEHFVLTLKPIGDVPAPKPGQFYMVGVGDHRDPLLKRPFCNFDSGEGLIRLLYRIRGRGTEMLSELRPGVAIPILGPLGNGYPMPKRGEEPLIVAGGTAIASVHPLIKELGKRCRVVYGARGSKELVVTDSVKGAPRDLYLCTEDGSTGERGNVIDVLKAIEIPANTIIYTCGPRGLARAVQSFAKERGLRGYVSLEEFMACGIGACMGCVCKTGKGFKRVCKEGPVFPLDEVTI